jgi:creatinine amidohydrolase
MEIEWKKLRPDELQRCCEAECDSHSTIGAIEQHGPHLPVETNALIADAIALGTARRLTEGGERAVVLPVMWTGLSEHHMSFGGTITLGLPAFQAVIEDICRSLQLHGLRGSYWQTGTAGMTMRFALSQTI